ncbi:MAG: hypothetical protein AAB263_00920 [Planctomycetota bacterium]
MRLRLRPLDITGDSVAVHGSPQSLSLWHHRLSWTCRQTPLDLRILGVEPVSLPSAEPSEPVPSAIARVMQTIAGQGALLLLANPTQALGTTHMAFAEGVRLIGITNDDDVACWDALLALGQPCYGVRGDLVVEVSSPRASSVISALAYGLFTCHDGVELTTFAESQLGVQWQTSESIDASVIGRGGFEIATSHGTTGSHTDTGREGTVRVVLRSGPRSCWTQPRFVAPRKGTCAE